eukprot:8543069-Pyramimonas_sp.AAC.1
MFQGMLQQPSRVRVRIDAPPWKRDHIGAVGRFYGTYRGCTNSEAMEIRGETGSGPNGRST